MVLRVGWSAERAPVYGSIPLVCKSLVHIRAWKPSIVTRCIEQAIEDVLYSSSQDLIIVPVLHWELLYQLLLGTIPLNIESVETRGT
jgi:hypothetical protein